MGNPVSPEKRRYRPFFIVSLLAIFLVCVVAITCVLVVTRDARLAAPLLVAVFVSTRMLGRAMVWLSTPEECKLFAAENGKEPVLGLIRDFMNRSRASTPTDKKTDSAEPPKGT